MKTKININNLKGSIVVCFFTVLFNFLFSMITYLLIWYWAIPNLCVVIPMLKAWLESLGDEALPAAYDILYAVSALIAVFPSSALAYRISKKRKKAFLAYSKGRISYMNGIKYHVSEYGVYDLVSIFGLVLVLTILYMIAGDVFIVRVFPIVFTMLQALGVVLGLLVAMILICASIVGAIFFSQKKWRAEYFFNE